MFSPEQIRWCVQLVSRFVHAHVRIADALEQIAATRVPVSTASTAKIEVDIDAGDGDPLVRFDPRDWKGEKQKGRKLSECSADFLDVLAGALEAMAASPKEGKEKYARGNAVTAAKARAWAKRKRADGSPAASEPDEFVD